MSDFLFHKVSDEEKEKIKRQAKEILDKFSEKLSAVDKKTADVSIERAVSERAEGGGKNPDEDFRKRVLENAPNKSDDFILGEKKSW